MAAFIGFLPAILEIQVVLKRHDNVLVTRPSSGMKLKINNLFALADKSLAIQIPDAFQKI